MTFKEKIKKLKKFAKKENSHVTVGIVGVIAGVTAAVIHYESQTVLNFSEKAQQCADSGAILGYDVNDRQYILVKRSWR